MYIKYLIISLLAMLFHSKILSQNANVHFKTDNIDWNLLDRYDHTMHMFAGQFFSVVPMLVFATRQEEINYKRGLIYGTTTSLTIVIGKELIYDYMLNKGTATYPDLVYGITGTVTGLIFSYSVLKVTKYLNNKEKERLKL